MPIKKLWKILIVDDDPTVHKLIGKSLSAECFEVHSVTDPTNALTEAQRLQPDLMILDLMMPRMSGMDVCRLVKQNPELKNTKVLILSAKETQDDRINGLDYGADDFVSKPFRLTSLVRKIEYMLTKNEEENSSFNELLQ